MCETIVSIFVLIFSVYRFSLLSTKRTASEFFSSYWSIPSVSNHPSFNIINFQLSCSIAILLFLNLSSNHRSAVFYFTTQNNSNPFALLTPPCIVVILIHFVFTREPHYEIALIAREAFYIFPIFISGSSAIAQCFEQFLFLNPRWFAFDARAKIPFY
jgi:hypothetical protein